MQVCFSISWLYTNSETTNNQCTVYWISHTWEITFVSWKTAKVQTIREHKQKLFCVWISLSHSGTTGNNLTNKTNTKRIVGRHGQRNFEIILFICHFNSFWLEFNCFFCVTFHVQCPIKDKTFPLSVLTKTKFRFYGQP